MSQNMTMRQWLSDVRRDFHRHPEIAFEERRTTDKIASLLRKMELDVQLFTDLTGVVGLCKGDNSGPTIGLRADIDALPIQERGQSSYRSVYDGVMHACGHDVNTAIMLGVAKKLVMNNVPLAMRGQVKFLFQPAEETGSGAKAMIERGVLANPSVDRIVAGHMSPNIPLGRAGIFKRLGYASSDHFTLVITGKGAHAARPEDGNDPIVATANLILQLQTIISRNITPTGAGVITVGKLQSGDVANAIPEQSVLEGTIRALSPAVRELIVKRLKELVAGLQVSFGVECNLLIHEGVPSCVNDEEVAVFLYEVASEVLGSGQVDFIEPIMGSEDFAYFARACPSAIMRLGCSNSAAGVAAPLHSPYFDVDEHVLEIGTEIFYRAVEKYLT
ncbi:MAG: amidohydrolase [Deltaproteobacteria bacterium]|nr:MAG: amidohydrolase [Deltaproteobacteria bacterium]